jgi:hypothetical protein
MYVLLDIRKSVNFIYAVMEEIDYTKQKKSDYGIVLGIMSQICNVELREKRMMSKVILSKWCRNLLNVT